LIIATDVTPAPSLIAKLGSTFGADITVPDHDLGHDEKDDLVAVYETAEMDTHAKDALAAAVNAYNRHRETIEEIHRKTADAGLEDEQDEIIQQAFSTSRSLTQIIEVFRQDDEQTAEGTEDTPDTSVDWEKTAKGYRKQLRKKENEIERLRSYNEEINDEKQDLQDELDDLRTERRQEAFENEEVQKWRQRAQNRKKETRKLKNRTKELENKLDRYRQALAYINDGETVYRICEDAEDLEDVDGSIAFVRKNLQVEPPSSIRAVIVENEDDAAFYEDHGVTAIDYRDLQGLKLEYVYIVDEDEVLDEIQETSETFISWLEEYRDRT